MQVSIDDIDSDALVRNTAFSNKAYRPGPEAVERTRMAAFSLVNAAYSQNLVCAVSSCSRCCCFTHTAWCIWAAPATLQIAWLHTDAVLYANADRGQCAGPNLLNLQNLTG